MAIWSFSGFSHLRPGVFLYKNKRRNTQNWEGGRKKQARIGLAPSARREKFVTLLCSFLCICRLLRACIRAKFPHSHQERWIILSRWPPRPLCPQDLAPRFAATFLRPSPSVRLLLTALFCWQLLTGQGACFPSSSSGLVGDLARKPFVWISRQNRQRNLLTGTHPHPQKRIVIYWPSTEPSIKRCTHVNKQKNNGSRWVLENNITRCPGWFESVGERMPAWEPAADRGLWVLSDPRLSNPAKCCYGRGRAWVNIAVRSCFHKITLSKIKCERFIFI